MTKKELSKISEKYEISEKLLADALELNSKDASKLLSKIRWPKKIKCTELICESEQVTKFKKINKWLCRKCDHQFTVKTNTLLGNSRLSEIKIYRMAVALSLSQELTWHSFKVITGITSSKTVSKIMDKVKPKANSIRAELDDNIYLGSSYTHGAELILKEVLKRQNSFRSKRADQ